jgi:DNA-binding SARP family transcriptional activator/tetratricopeptide (TPR) repeat protein
MAAIDGEQGAAGAWLGALVREHRRAAGLTQRQLANRSGLSVAAVRDLEQGRSRRPRAGSLAGLARALGLDDRQSAELAAARDAARPASRGAPAGHGSGLWLAVLGPLVAWRDGLSVALGPPRQAAVLGLLALQPGELVHREAVIEALWGQQPPGTSAELAQAYVSRLRRVLDPGGSGGLLEQGAAGYRLRVSAGELDAAAFTDLAGRAGTAAASGDAAAASALYAQALGLWRGEPAADAEVLRGHPALAGLTRRRADAVLGYADAACGLGWHQRVLPLLEALARDQPLEERAHARLMVALAGAGQQAAAIEVFEDLRRRLSEELGVRPGAEITAAHQRVLRQDIPPASDGNTAVTSRLGSPQHAGPPPAPGVRYSLPPDTAAFTGRQAGLDRIAPAGTDAAGDVDVLRPPRSRAEPRPDRPSAVPRQLPAAVRHFIGRQAELDELIRVLEETGAPGGMVVISAIDGMAGIGKTALVTHAAHRLAGTYPDGQLFIDLHGYTRGQRPRTADQALGWLLRALGVPPERIPKDGEQAAALYRQRLADSRTLIVLDNAAAEAQVRPLLPGADGCLVLVTSRRRLKGLDDAHSVSLDLLAAPDAVALLRAVAGPDRVPDGDPLAGEVAQLCGHLPLALRIAAALLRHRPAWSLEHLAGLLREQHGRVPALSDGDRDLSTVFDLSYRSLSGDLQRVFRCLGLVPGPDLDAYATAALAGTDPATAAGLLEGLVDHNLLIAYAPGRYRLHDLVRAHARTLAAAVPDRGSALDRLLHYYARTAHSASVPMARYPQPAPAGPTLAYAPECTSAETARAWLRAERENLEAAHAHALTLGLHGHAIALASGLAEILRSDGPFTRALELQQSAAEAAERHGRPAAHASALTNLGILRCLTGDLAGATDTLSRALEIHRATGNPHGEAAALAELGWVRCLTGDLAGATEALSRALEIHRATGNPRGEGTAVTYLGIVRRLTGDLAGATEALCRALEIHRATGNPHGEGTALTELGIVRRLTGDLAGATDTLSRALEIHRATGNPHNEAAALAELGWMRRLTGDLAGATDTLCRALEIHRATGDPDRGATALTYLGSVRRLTGDLAGATDTLSRALEIHRATGNRHNEAWALNHYAAAIAATGDLPRALPLYRQALTTNRELNKPDDEAIAHEGLGECHLSTAQTEPGTAHLRQALEIFQRLGMAPDASRLQDRLDDLAAGMRVK